MAVALLGASAALGVFFVLGGPEVLAAASRLSPAWLAVAVGLDLVSWFGEAVVFAALAGRLTPRGLVEMIGVYVGGGFPALVTPFGSGGIPGWTWSLTQEGLGAGEAAAVVGARAVVTSAFFAVAGASAVMALPASAGGPTAWAAVAGLVALVAALALTVARPDLLARGAAGMLRSRLARRVAGARRADRVAARVEKEAVRFGATLRTLVTQRPGALFTALIGLLVSRACLLAVLPAVLAGLGHRGDFLPIVATVIGVWVLASSAPTPGGAGAVEAGATAALSRFVAPEVAGAAVLLWRGLTFYLDLVVGWLLFTRYVARGPRPAPQRTC